MKAATVVEAFDVIEDHDLGLLFGYRDEGAEALGFECGPQKDSIMALS